MVFIHGESFEWNSGNPYDGTILAAYGNVVFVTINFRLGILGFLRPGIRDDTASNFGLLDQIAALLWLRENIVDFGGDPDSITLVGHGTGAIFANLLLISPVANKKGLFNRAILMSGSALSADAIGKAPLQITKQVAHALNCPTTTDSDLAFCLRGQDVNTLLNVKIHKPSYVPAFAPLIDNAVIPDKPLNLMKNPQLFGRFDLMYGVTESEKFHVLPPVALLHGMLDGQRDEVLREHAKATHELEPELILSKILEQYSDFSAGFTNEYTLKNRDLVLEALSDSGTVAPLIMTANLHSKANPKSYMYVFSHPKAMQDYSGQQRQRTVHGEELPYVLGVPLDGSKYERRRYNIGETLFSEAMMNWWCSFAYSGNPNIAKRYPYLTDGLKEWDQYNIDWPEYDPQNQTYLNLTIPPSTSMQYRFAEMQFWNEHLPNLLRHPGKDIPLPLRPRGRRPPILDIADGIGRYANASRDYDYGNRFKADNNQPATTDVGSTTQDSTTSQTEEDVIPQPSTPKSSSVITMLTGFGVVFLLINFTAFVYLYCKKQDAKTKGTGLKRRISQKDESRRAKSEKYENHYGELGYKSDSKPDINDVIKNDKAYDNNSNFGRRSKLSRQNSGSTIDTHIKVREWIQQEIVHRCSPRFLRKTRETLQKEHQDKLTKQQEDEKKRQEEDLYSDRKEEPIYDENPALVVRPGKKSKVPKVSVAVDATPATRTESILNQVPIELAKGVEANDSFDKCIDYMIDPSQLQTAPQVVVIEHHHSKSDPLPMENVLKSVKPNFSTPRIYESDSGSTSSLYAKINPKLKSRLPRAELGINADGSVVDQTGEIYMKMGPKLTTFGVNSPPTDINVTCREPTVERECISPEEALRTIKRRNYPKVLPDIEKRRSLPAPSSLFAPKQHSNSLKDYRSGLHSSSSTHQPPQPPPRMFGPSKSLEFAEESENQFENEPVTTNLHVGPLLRRQDYSTKNNSDPSIIDSLDERIDRTRAQAGGSVDTIYSNPVCPVHEIVQPISQSVDKIIGNPAALLETGIGNPNWYKSSPTGNEAYTLTTSSEPRIIGREMDRQPQFGGSNWETRIPGMEPRIVITPRVGNLLGQANQCLSQTVTNLTGTTSDNKVDRDVRTAITYDSNPSTRTTASSVEQLQSDTLAASTSPESRLSNISHERKEPRIIITPRDTKGSSSNLKQPKIIIKPTSSLQRNRDHRNIPKVSAIPPPEQVCSTIDREKPPLKEKPKVTRIPSFSRRKEESSGGTERPAYPEKTEIVQRVEAVAVNKGANVSVTGDGKSSIPTLQRKESEKCSSPDTSTGTIKKKPVNRK
ncbi:Neuroligin-4, X-linked [Anthophora retusa]